MLFGDPKPMVTAKPDDAQPQSFAAPLPVGSFTVYSIDEARLSLKAGPLDLLQMSPGKLNYSLSMSQLGHIQIYRERSDKPLLKRGVNWPGSLVFSFVVQARGRGWLSGREVDPRASLVADGEELPEIITPAELDLLFIVVDRQWLSERIGDGASRQITGGARNLRCFAAWHEHALVLRRLSPLLPGQSLAGPPGSSIRHPALLPMGAAGGATLAEEMVLEALLDVLGSVHRVEALRETDHKRLIDQARRLMRGDAPERATMTQVAAHLGVSRRHLQTCFNTSVGIPAIEFVRAERLNQVRKALVEARRAGLEVSIGDIAADWGFWHLSRFAADYRDMFGELPSKTLRPYAPPAARRAAQRITSQNG
ncbi:helix-turn-helix domain-containing protein [Herbaspirillum seropedicae]|uniref:helix-turn-helix domain-containing protein n=1 Tax=Herbaspirillum seropedicae TaxID=964 RepID=UPI003D97A69D